MTDGLLLDTLPELLTPDWKQAKIHSLLTNLARKHRAIVNTGTRKQPQWVLASTPASKQ